MSLSNGNVGGMLYGTYATNVPIYNAALQRMVNQRHALGQNVFLADMFSVVDYNSMFQTDHVHPNTLGLQTIAQEWFTRIKSIIITTNLVTTTLIHGGDVWKYSDTGQDLGTNWSQTNYDDSGWASGPARLGYPDAPVLTTVNYGSDTNNKYITTYFRDTFVPPANTAITNLNFRLSRVDGAVVWLNGQEAFRTNMPAGPISFTNETAKVTIGEASFIFFPANIPVSNLPPGTNVIGVEVHIRLPTRLSMGMDMELIGTGYILPPSLAIACMDGNILLTWPVANGTGYSLYTSTDLSVPGGWTNAGATIQTNGGQYTATLSPDAITRFFRLQRP